jgi:hypothetical protein
MDKEAGPQLFMPCLSHFGGVRMTEAGNGVCEGVRDTIMVETGDGRGVGDGVDVLMGRGEV